MARLCERPGCSTPAEVSYGFDAEHLVVWLDAFTGPLGSRSGVLCLRHANAMVVPLGWMLDDRREPVPRLFRSPATDDAPKRRRAPRAGRGPADDTEQLLLEPALVLAIPDEAADVAVAVAGDDDAPLVAADEVEGTQPWQPLFDTEDDLSGLLRARGRLLSRAFRGAPRGD
jgi:hypothetical protein